jgi:hypothetical protein
MLEKLSPATIAPIVLYLCSEQNQETKKIFNCAAGWFSRTEILCSDGIRIGKETITAEDILMNWNRISGFENGKALANLGETFKYLAG